MSNNNKPIPSKLNLSNQDNSAWFPRDIPMAPDGILHQSLSLPRLHPQPAHVPSVDSNAKSHEILGGIILGAGHHNLAQNLNATPLPTSYVSGVVPTRTKQELGSSLSNKPLTPKSSKYVGVTFRPTRVKYQARIYKCNKEYNLGLFDVSADAALAYDVTHRLMIEMGRIGEEELSQEKNVNAFDGDTGAKKENATASLEQKASAAIAARVAIELSNLTGLEMDPQLSSSALNWLDEADTDTGAVFKGTGFDAKECERMNFHHPNEYYAARRKEIEERNLSIDDASTLSNEKKTASCQGTCPRIDDLKKFVRQEAIRVAKAVISHSAGVPVPVEEAVKKKRKKDSDKDLVEAEGKRRKSQDIAHTPNPPVPTIPPIADGSMNADVSRSDNISAFNPASDSQIPMVHAGMENGKANDAKQAPKVDTASLTAGQFQHPQGGVGMGANRIGLTPGMGLSPMMTPMMNGTGVGSMGMMGMNGIAAGAVGVDHLSGMASHGAGLNRMYGASALGVQGMEEANALCMQHMGLSGLGHHHMNTLAVNGAAGVGVGEPSALHMHGMAAHPMNATAMSSSHVGAYHMNPQMNAMAMTSTNGLGMHGGHMMHLQPQTNPLMMSDAAMMGSGHLVHYSLHGMSSMAANPYGHFPGGYVGGDAMMMMAPSAMGVYPAGNMMMAGVAGSAMETANHQQRLMLQQRQHEHALHQQALHQQALQGQYGMNPYMNDREMKTMGGMGGAPMVGLNPHQNNLEDGPLSGINHNAMVGLQPATANQAVSGNLGATGATRDL